MPPASQIASTVRRYAALLADAGLLLADAGALPDAPIARAACDSRDVVPQTLFVCKGAAFKRAYLDAAIDAGATAYVSEAPYDGAPIPCLPVRDIRRAQALIADAAYGHPSGGVSVCGITGTKGKTTSVYYLKGILDEASRAQGAPAAAFITGIRYDDGIRSGISTLTTPEPFDLQLRIANARAARLPYLAMEVSSQALKYHRVAGVEFAVGAFTNIGEDHISPAEHPDFEDYFASKLMLFAHCRAAVVNLDTDHARRVLDAARQCERTVAYSALPGHGDVSLTKAERRDGGFDVEVATPAGALHAHIPTPAMFNVSNALAAIACAVALDIDIEAIARGVSGVQVPGRMETFASADGRIAAVVDYAHNGMSMEALLSNLRESYPGRRLSVVFGSAGCKGIDRRAAMGHVAGRMADAAVLTEDDPWTEDPCAICDEIVRAMDAEGGAAYRVVLDREQAIAHAFQDAAASGRDCIVAVAGKGHETTIKRADGPEPWPTDAELVRQALAAYDETGR